MMSISIEQKSVKFAVILAVLVSLLMISTANAGKNWRAEGNSKASQMAQNQEMCVRDTDFMRRNHMELIQHDRDVTVHQGIRTLDGSLKECVTCHANKHESGEFVPVTAMSGPGGSQFCASCHAYTSVSLDCFQCHSTVPTE
jgi:hypothetical protein